VKAGAKCFGPFSVFILEKPLKEVCYIIEIYLFIEIG
jgi:hypothetical protein